MNPEIHIHDLITNADSSTTLANVQKDFFETPQECGPAPKKARYEMSKQQAMSRKTVKHVTETNSSWKTRKEEEQSKTRRVTYEDCDGRLPTGLQDHVTVHGSKVGIE